MIGPRSVSDASLSTQRVPDRLRTLIGTIIGVAVIIVAWALLSLRYPEIILPSPTQTWDAMVKLASDGTLFIELGRTLARSVIGVALALVIGGVWGTLNGLSRWFSAITRPATSALMALPPVIMVTIAMVWFGPGPGVTRIVIIIVALPLIVMAIEAAIGSLDPDLLEMARVFGVPRRLVLRHIVAPGIASPVAAVVSVTIGQAMRVAVMAELLAATDGIGAEIALSRTNLATAELFAWAFVMVAAVILIESLILTPVNNRLSRWRMSAGIPLPVAGRAAARRML